jgi:hypothetical protein
MARYRVLSWRGIPAQLKVFTDEGRPKSVPLDDWFIAEIDRVAMREGLVGTDAYLEQFEWSDDIERRGPSDEVAAEVVAELEAEWLPANRRL